MNLGLPNFVRSVLYLPERVLDLLELAAYVFAADRLVLRGRRDSTVFEGWSRSFTFQMKVRDVKFWSRNDVKAALSECLTFMTGDAGYEFHFDPGHSTTPTTLFDKEEFAVPPSPAPKILLFSGGLDSLAGAIELLEAGEHICLVSHRSQPGTMRTQDSLANALKSVPRYRGRVQHYRFASTLRGTRAVEETQRSRMFLYASIAFALQLALGVGEIAVYENGITSLNFPRREDQVSARASRTTHPRTIRLLERLFTLVAGQASAIVQPFLWKTKADVFSSLKAAGQAPLISSSVSCSETRSKKGPAPQCGVCLQCLDRRFAAFASGNMDIDHAGLYAHDINTEELTGAARTVIVDYIRQARDFADSSADHFYEQRANELVDVVEGLQMPEAVAVNDIWELCARHGKNVAGAIRAIRSLYDDPYRPLAIGSVLHLVADREYLKEPANRAIEALIGRVEPQVVRMFAGGRLPINENDFNQKIGSLIGVVRPDLASEHPSIEFACGGVTPDHELRSANVLIESKYIRKGTPPSKASDGMAADLTKYRDDRHVLFIVYDPTHMIRDTKKFIGDFEARGRCTVRVLR